MRFGGHETFHVREGWFAKALQLLPEQVHLLQHENCEDCLGVGRNMAKSIKHWIVACGLAEARGVRKAADFVLTPMGSAVKEADPHFTDICTWWALHLNLINNKKDAYSWWWFFNEFAIRRFERGVCVETLRRYVHLNESRVPSQRTLDRDVGCLLSTYSRRLPPLHLDPEDGAESPFQELGLLTHFAGSGNYGLNYGRSHIPFEIFGYAVARSTMGEEATGDVVDQSFTHMLERPGAPARAFLLEPEELLSMLQDYENDPRSQLHVRGHAGERRVTMPNRKPEEWLQLYYETATESV